jgi:integrase
MVSRRKTVLVFLKGEGMNKFLKDLGHVIDYPEVSHHTLRRTFGRIMYRAAPDRVPTIAKIMGHDSIDQCPKYLGIDPDDMTAMMAANTLGKKE